MLWLIVKIGKVRRAVFSVFLSAVFCILLGCASSPRPSVTESSLPNLTFYLNEPKVPVLPVSEVTQLSKRAQQDFWAFFNQPKFSKTPRHERVASYLSLIMDQFEYSENTYTASQTLEFRSGNCLSLSLLTTAYAQLASVDIDYHLLERNPVYSLHSNILVESEHIRAVLNERVPSGSDEGFSLIKKIVIDFFDSSGYEFRDHLSVTDQVSLYYSNRAVELMLDKRYAESLAYVQRAVDLSPKNFSAINTAAILLSRKGEVQTAERLYRHGLESARRLTFLKNYVNMLTTFGRETEAQDLRKEYSLELKSSPGYWVSEARRAESTGDLELAALSYKKAVALAPDIHQLHFLMSYVHFQLGRFHRSKQNLSDAITLADSKRQRTKYKIKHSQF